MAEPLMDYLQFPTDRPVSYINSGLFSAAVGWQHHVVEHGEDIEVMIGLSGSVALTVADRAYDLGAGDVLTVFPHEVIQGTHKTVSPSSFIWFHVEQPGTRQVRVPQPTSLPRFVHLKQQAQTVIAAHQLLDLAHDQSTQRLLADYQASLVMLTIANAAANQRQQVASHQSLINSVKEWTRINLGAHPRVTDIADHFYLNPDYLNRTFKRETGTTLTAYMNELRIEYAKLLLLGTNDSVQEIASLAYFKDSKYFARVFRQKVHLSPRAYRQAYTHTYLNNNNADPGMELKPLVQSLERNAQGD